MLTCGLAHAEPERPPVVRVDPANVGSRLYFDELPDRPRIELDGVEIPFGVSKRFETPPKFALFHSARHDPDSGIGYPATELLREWEIPNEARYPVQIRRTRDPFLSGLVVVGAQSRELPWRVMKEMWDGDALHVKECSGRLDVTRVFWENVEDGLGPEPGLDFWSLRDSCLRYIRDDAVENDSLVPGEVVNCLIDGCFTFLSQRPEPAVPARIVTSIRDSLIHVQAQPHDGIPGKRYRDRNIEIGDDGIGRAPGMLFKWAPGAGEVEMKRCILLIDGISINGREDLEFPPGLYEEVVLVWRGGGSYPARVPDGVEVTDDLSLWTAARSKWIRSLDERHPAKARLIPTLP